MNIKSVRLLLASTAFAALGSLGYAGPGPQYWESLTREAQFRQLKAGEKIAYICNECKTSSEITIKSPAQAMELCKEHATVSCPACKKTTKVGRKTQRNDAPTHSEVIYVNEKGEECAFFAKAVSSTEPLRNEAQFHLLKVGDKVAYACNQCKTVSETGIESHAQAMTLCKVGESVACPSCKKTTKVVMKSGRNDPPARYVIAYVNEKGEECAFVTKVIAK
jgi:hypothetical protein